jgi:hypothetical protein
MAPKKATNLIKETISKVTPKSTPLAGSEAPRKEITQSQSGSDQRSNGWVVCFITYENPVPNYFRDDKDIMRIVTNDAISVTTSSSKGSFGKTAQVTLKSADDFYPSIVSNGDWCFIWMTDNMTDRQNVLESLAKIRAGQSAGNTLVRYDSGLKFAGRVTSCNSSDTVQATGARTITQNISAQSFLEFASTVYNTGTIIKLEPTSVKAALNGPQSVEAVTQLIQDVAVQTQLTESLSSFTKKTAEAFKNLMNKQDPAYNSPDRVISLYYLLSMGIDKPQQYLPGVPANFNSGITIPSKVSAIFNKPSARKLWQLIDIHAGIQKFTSDKTAWYKGFVPNLKSDQAENIKNTGIPTKGYVPFKFELWSNMSLWSIFSKHLNPVVNEMFTSLRLNQEGNLNLTLTIREKPFSTGLFSSIGANKSYYTGQTAIAPKNDNLSQTPGDEETPPELKLNGPPSKKDNKIYRTLYGEVPRWVINDSVVRSYSSSTNENDRINFVMVWGRSTQAEMLNPKVNMDSFMSQQFHNGNYFLNPGDISRNGLRSSIMESHYDTYYSDRQAVSNASTWARQNADWLFNGHLKLNASLTVNGIQDAIAEGDNLEYRGILYHIEAISHSASVSASGQKNWTTTLSLSNGVLASSLDNPDSLPLYAFHQTQNRDELKYPLAPGVTSARTEG